MRGLVTTGPAALAETGHNDEEGVPAPRGMKVQVSAQQAPGGILVHARTANSTGIPTPVPRVRVTLNANNHAEYVRHGHPIQDTMNVTVPEPLHE